MSSLRQRQTEEISELQAEQNRKRKRVVAEGEQELGELRDDYEKRKEALIERSEAAINHIRKEQAETIENASEQRARAQERSQTQVNKIEDFYRKKIADTQKNRGELLQEADSRSEAKIKEHQERSQQRLATLETTTQEQYEKAREKSHTTLERETKEQRERVEQLRNANQSEQNREIERGRTQIDKVHTENEENFTRTRKQGDDAIAHEKESKERKLNRLNSEFEKAYTRKQKEWNDRVENLDHENTNRIALSKDRNDEQIRVQKKRFDSLYAKNDQAQRRAVNLQETNYQKELNELKKDFLREANKYSGKENDPFYKVQDRGSRMSETPHYYVIDAYVPEHEKDAVKVTVEKGKVSIQGQRAFKDKFDSDEDGKKVSTATFQSFREEFPFDKPVITEGMTRERDGDWVRLVVPKLQNYSRKA